MTMGEKILNMRKARGWSQEELAEQIGVSRQAVSRWESGTAKPDADKILAICDQFGVSADYLLRENLSEKKDGQESICISANQPRMPVVTPVQILGILMILFGMILIFVLIIMSTTGIYEYTVATFDRVVTYRGLWGYVKTFDFEWLLFVDGFSVLAGTVLLLRRGKKETQK